MKYLKTKLDVVIFENGDVLLGKNSSGDFSILINRHLFSIAEDRLLSEYNYKETKKNILHIVF